MKKTALLLAALAALLFSCTKDTPKPADNDEPGFNNDIIDPQFTYAADVMNTVYYTVPGARGAFLIYGFIQHDAFNIEYIVREVAANGFTLWQAAAPVESIGYYYNTDGSIAGYVLVGSNTKEVSTHTGGYITTIEAGTGIQKDYHIQNDFDAGVRLNALIEQPRDACGAINYFALGAAYRYDRYYPYTMRFQVTNDGQIEMPPQCPSEPQNNALLADYTQPDKCYTGVVSQNGYQIALLKGSGPLAGKSFIQKIHTGLTFTPDWEITDEAFYQAKTLTTDNQGNYYIAGSMSDKTSPHDTTYWRDAVISKFSNTGQMLWKKNVTPHSPKKYDDVYQSIALRNDKLYAVGATRMVNISDQSTGNAMITVLNTNGDITGYYEVGSNSGYSGFNSCLFFQQKLFCFGYKSSTDNTSPSAWIVQTKL
jgi:hypothetical protein